MGISIDNAPVEYRHYLRLGDTYLGGLDRDFFGRGDNDQIDQYIEAKVAAEEYKKGHSTEKYQSFLEYLERSGYPIMLVNIKPAEDKQNTCFGIDALAVDLFNMAVIEGVAKGMRRDPEKSIKDILSYVENNSCQNRPSMGERLVNRVLESGLLEQDDERGFIFGIRLLEEVSFSWVFTPGLQARVLEALWVAKQQYEVIQLDPKIADLAAETFDNVAQRVDPKIREQFAKLE